MRKMIVMLFAALVLGLLAPFGSGSVASAAPAPGGAPAAAAVERQAVVQAKKRQGAGRDVNRRGLSARDMRVWNRLAQCEATGRWRINTGNGYYGGLQISPSTWRGFGGKKYASNAHRASKFEQVKIAQRIKRGQGWGAWPSCSSKLGLR